MWLYSSNLSRERKDIRSSPVITYKILLLLDLYCPILVPSQSLHSLTDTNEVQYRESEECYKSDRHANCTQTCEPNISAQYPQCTKKVVQINSSRIVTHEIERPRFARVEHVGIETTDVFDRNRSELVARYCQPQAHPPLSLSLSLSLSRFHNIFPMSKKNRLNSIMYIKIFELHIFGCSHCSF